MLPLVVALAGTGPSITATSPVQAGATLTIKGDGFDQREWVEFSWDGSTVAWLPPVKSQRDTTLTATVIVPAGTAAGNHLLELRMKQNGRDSKPKPEVVATAVVTVGNPVTRQAAATAPVAPTPTAPAAAPSSAPTSAPTQAPMAPAPVATSMPTSTATHTPAPTPRSTTTPTLAPNTPVATPVPTTPIASAGGYGARTIGGTGGRTIVVTNLNDSGAGSFRAAVEASGARTVVFGVGGTISMSSDVKISNPYLTIAGETAPAPVVIRGAGTIVRTHEVIIRNVRFRPGDQVASPSDVDALTINGMSSAVSNVVIDRVSMVWGPDIGGLAILGDVRNVTVRNSIMGEGLYLSRHAEGTASEGGHSHAVNITQMDGGSAWPRYLTFVGNLFTTSDTRIPRLQGAECVDMINNVIYNWGKHAAHGNPRSLNLVNNWYRSGPERATDELWDSQTSAVSPRVFGASVYESGNRADGFAGRRGGETGAYTSTIRCGGFSVPVGTPEQAYASVIANAGATLPTRDAVDARIINNVLNRTGTFFNGAGFPGPNPYWK